MKKSSKTSGPKASRNKSDQVISLLRRNAGVAITELARLTGWQRHSVHGFMSGTLKRKRGLAITNSKEGNDERRYWIKEGKQ
jgi:hypothetical protein